VKDLPWFKFTALQANIPREIVEDLTIEKPSTEQVETLEQFKEKTNQIIERIKAQAEKAKTEPIHLPPLELPKEKEFQPSKTCGKQNCQVLIPSSVKYCDFHQ